MQLQMIPDSIGRIYVGKTAKCVDCGGEYTYTTKKGVRCSDCRFTRKNLMRRAWENEHPEEFKRHQQGGTDLKAQKSLRISAIKIERGCIDCGYNDHPVALDFDHIEGEKKAPVSWLTSCSWEVIEAEIAKCDVVCSNCHRIRTFNRRRGQS